MFTRRLFPGEQRPGYELLGLLLLLQIAAQSYFSLTTNKTTESDPTSSLVKDILSVEPVGSSSGGSTAAADDDQLASPERVLDLADDNVLPYIPAGSRRCPLCLDPMKDPTAAECGHLFCWTCILRWTGEAVAQGECPICRGRCGREGLLRLSG
jgi:peroxin-10